MGIGHVVRIAAEAFGYDLARVSLGFHAKGSVNIELAR
jgi:hypothetical protein